MGDCEDCCSEHNMRVEIMKRNEQALDELFAKVDAIETSIEQRRTIIDKKLEIGVEKFASLEHGQRILIGLLVVFLTIAGYSYLKAADASEELKAHKAEDKGEFNILKSHMEYHAQVFAREEKQDEDVHELKTIAASTEQVLKNIEARLGNIEKKM